MAIDRRTWMREYQRRPYRVKARHEYYLRKKALRKKERICPAYVVFEEGYPKDEVQEQ